MPDVLRMDPLPELTLFWVGGTANVPVTAPEWLRQNVALLLASHPAGLEANLLRQCYQERFGSPFPSHKVFSTQTAKASS